MFYNATVSKIMKYGDRSFKRGSKCTVLALGVEMPMCGQVKVIFQTDRDGLERWVNIDKIKFRKNLKANLLRNQKELIKYLEKN